MACHRPIPATELDGFVSLQHSATEAALLPGQYLELPCGTCQGCRARRVRDWAIRCYHEAQTHTRRVGGGEVVNGCFITLTYDNDHLPPDGSLQLAHWQNFLKRLRHRLRQPIRYLHCGEYGTNGTKRPHYHACLFGVDFHEDRYEWRSDGKNIEWRSPLLERSWGMGFATLSPLNFATASYVAGYVTKKMRSDRHLEEHGYITPDLKVAVKKPEYITMSRGNKNGTNGLGHDWFQQYWPDVYPHDEVRIEGRSYRPPAYYDRLLFDRDPALHETVMLQRRAHLEAQGPTTPAQLRARGAIFMAQHSERLEKRNENF